MMKCNICNKREAKFILVKDYKKPKNLVSNLIFLCDGCKYQRWRYGTGRKPKYGIPLRELSKQTGFSVFTLWCYFKSPTLVQPDRIAKIVEVLKKNGISVKNP